MNKFAQKGIKGFKKGHSVPKKIREKISNIRKELIKEGKITDGKKKNIRKF